MLPSTRTRKNKSPEVGMSLEYSRNRKEADGTGAMNKPRQEGWFQITAAEAPSLLYAKDTDVPTPEIDPWWIQASRFLKALQAVLRTIYTELCGSGEEFVMYSRSNGRLLGILAHVEALLLCSMTLPVFENSSHTLFLGPLPLLLPPAFSSSEHHQFLACTLAW